MDFLKSVLAALVVMALPILVVVPALVEKSRNAEPEITITPGKVYSHHDVVANQGDYQVVRNTRYRWEKQVVCVTIDTVKIDKNAASDAAYINHAVGIPGW